MMVSDLQPHSLKTSYKKYTLHTTCPTHSPVV